MLGAWGGGDGIQREDLGRGSPLLSDPDVILAPNPGLALCLPFGTVSLYH